MSDSSTQNQGCLAAIFRLIGFGKKETLTSADAETLPYRIRDDFLSPAERSFFLVLKDVLGEKAVICPKVNLADIFYVTRPHENQAYRNRIAYKHLDFLLCHPRTLDPIVGIELNDSSHSREDRQQRDAFVRDVFRTAGLSLVSVPVQHGYNTAEIQALLDPYLTGSPASTPKETPASAVFKAALTEAPYCPKCGVKMVLRKATRGENQGKQFYGCPNYPRCREIIPVE